MVSSDRSIYFHLVSESSRCFLTKLKWDFIWQPSHISQTSGALVTFFSHAHIDQSLLQSPITDLKLPLVSLLPPWPVSFSLSLPFKLRGRSHPSTVIVSPNTFYLLIMNLTVLLRIDEALKIFLYPSPESALPPIINSLLALEYCFYCEIIKSPSTPPAINQ